MALLKTIQIGMLCLFLSLGFGLAGCEKDEHPSEHPSKEGAAELTKDELADAIEVYIEDTSAKQEGKFTAFDPKTGTTLELTLDKVHRERLSKVGDDLYFACADFKTPQGKVYDLDVFMKGSSKDDLTFTEFTIHKEEGKERYTWYEEEGVWLRKGLEEVEKTVPKEHPKEHPEGTKEHPEGSEEHPKSEHPEHPK
jgi:hypothetical protein